MSRLAMSCAFGAVVALTGCFDLPADPFAAALREADAPEADAAAACPDGGCALGDACLPEGAPHPEVACWECVGGAFETCAFGCEEAACVRPVGVAAGGRQSCAWTADGRVFCWGWQEHGQLGNGLVAASPSRPVRAGGLPDLVALTTGDRHVCGRTAAGAALCWGANDRRQLGHVSTYDHRPAEVAGPPAAVLAAGPLDTTCALDQGGGVRCWGVRLDGQGWSGAPASALPQAVPAGERVFEALAVGGVHACATALGGLEVLCWGHGGQGQLGPGAEGGPAPVLVGAWDAPVADLAAGFDHTCALGQGGTSVRCWGANDQGQAGQPPEEAALVVAPTALAQPLPEPAVALSAGQGHTCAVGRSGAVYCWGDNARGQLGTNTVGRSHAPLRVEGLPAAAAVAAGRFHTCAVGVLGSVSCWGYNAYGQLGNGKHQQAVHPERVRVRWTDG